MYIRLSSSYSPMDMAGDSMGARVDLLRGAGAPGVRRRGVAARSMMTARVKVVAGAAARMEVVAGAKGIARAVIYLPIM